MNISPLAQTLLEAGFADGWALADDVLVLWQHEQDPPAPLTRPKATHETPSAD
jgi:hypothetical protein